MPTPDPADRPVVSVRTIFVVAAAVAVTLFVLAALSTNNAGPPAAPTAPATGTDPSPPPLDDTTPVIGVTVEGRHRAYRLADLLQPTDHVLNDLWGTTPVTVAFCDLSNCVRAYSGPAGHGQPLGVRVGGPHPTLPRTMMLEVDGRRYELETGEGENGESFPYPALPAVRTTWGEWRRRHPDTDVRAGGRVHPRPAGGW